MTWFSKESLARRRSGAVALAAGTSLVAASLISPTAAVGVENHSASVQARSAAVRHLDARLRGDSAGDPNGTGRAEFKLNRARGRVCAQVTWHRIGKPNAAHIHRKSDGGVVVDLTGSVTGGSNCATGVSHKLIKRILAHPRRYYFNVHNTKYPAGAIRGTLHR